MEKFEIFTVTETVFNWWMSSSPAPKDSPDSSWKAFWPQKKLIFFKIVLESFSLMIFIIHTLMTKTPPWFGSNLVLLLYKIFYHSLLLGGEKPHILNTFWWCTSPIVCFATPQPVKFIVHEKHCMPAQAPSRKPELPLCSELTSCELEDFWQLISSGLHCTTGVVWLLLQLACL